MMYNCSHCQKECKNHNSFRNHERLCKFNPNRQQSSFKYITQPWNKGLTKDDPRVAKNAQKVSEALKGKPSKVIWTEEMRKARSEWRKQLHKDHPETHPNRRLAGNRNKMTYPEKVAYEYLEKMGIKFEHQKKIDKFFPDFVIDNIIIEIDGANWHNKEKDAERDKILSTYGYKVFRILSSEKIEEKIAEILHLPK
jgi:very-short-patch-repair endonuclease